MNAKEKISFFLRLSWWITIAVRAETHEASQEIALKILQQANELHHKLENYILSIHLSGRPEYSEESFLESFTKEAQTVGLNIGTLVEEILNNEFSTENKLILI